MWKRLEKLILLKVKINIYGTSFEKVAVPPKVNE